MEKDENGLYFIRCVVCKARTAKLSTQEDAIKNADNVFRYIIDLNPTGSGFYCPACIS